MTFRPVAASRLAWAAGQGRAAGRMRWWGG